MCAKNINLILFLLIVFCFSSFSSFSQVEQKVLLVNVESSGRNHDNVYIDLYRTLTWANADATLVSLSESGEVSSLIDNNNFGFL